MQSQYSLFTSFITLVVIGGIAVFGAFSNIQADSLQQNSAPNPLNQDVESFREYTQNTVIFYSRVFLRRNKTQVTIPFSFKDNQPQILTFGFSTPEGTKEYLVYHPQLEGITWSSVTNGELTLYQRSKTYESVEQFIENPPTEGFVVDPILHQRYEQLQDSPTTNSPFEFESTEFILTTYKPSIVQGNAYYYQTVIDASQALLDTQNQIEWFIRAPQVTEENPYYLGNLDINYLQ